MVQCPYCNNEYASHQSLSNHKKTCKSRPVPPPSAIDEDDEGEYIAPQFNDTEKDDDPPYVPVNVPVNVPVPVPPERMNQPAIQYLPVNVPIRNFQEQVTTTKMSINQSSPVPRQQPAQQQYDLTVASNPRYYQQQPQFKPAFESLANILFNSVDAVVRNDCDDAVIESVISCDDQFKGNLERLDKFFYIAGERRKQELKIFNEQVEKLMDNGIKDEDIEEILNVVGDEKITVAEEQYQMKLCTLKAKMWEKDILQKEVDRNTHVTEKIRSAIRKIIENTDGTNFNAVMMGYLQGKKNHNNLARIKRRLWLKRNWLNIVGFIVLLFAVLVGMFLFSQNWIILYVGFGILFICVCLIVYFMYF
jgi:hypothetical protein